MVLPDGCRASHIRVESPTGWDDLYISNRTGDVAALGYTRPFGGHRWGFEITGYRWWGGAKLASAASLYRDGELLLHMSLRRLIAPAPPSVVPSAPVSVMGHGSAPIWMVAGTPTVTALVNGRPCRLIVDTGDRSMHLNLEAARRLGVVAGEPTTTDIAGADGYCRLAVVRSLRVGTAEVRNLVVHVDRESRPAAIALDGGLGWAFLGHFNFAVDYPHERLTLDPAGSALRRGIHVKFDFADDGAWIEGVVAGRRLRMAVDTGAMDIWLPDELQRELARVQPHRGASLLTPVSAGGITVDDCPSFSWKHDYTRSTTDGLPPLLGGAFLRHFVVSFDARREMMTLGK